MASFYAVEAVTSLRRLRVNIWNRPARESHFIVDGLNCGDEPKSRPIFGLFRHNFVHQLGCLVWHAEERAVAASQPLDDYFHARIPCVRDHHLLEHGEQRRIFLAQDVGCGNVAIRLVRDRIELCGLRVYDEFAFPVRCVCGCEIVVEERS